MKLLVIYLFELFIRGIAFVIFTLLLALLRRVKIVIIFNLYLVRKFIHGNLVYCDREIIEFNVVI